MVWAKQEDAGLAASRSDTELVEASSRQSRRWDPAPDWLMHAVMWLVNIQGDVWDEQDGGEGGHQVQVNVPQVTAQVTL